MITQEHSPTDSDEDIPSVPDEIVFAAETDDAKFFADTRDALYSEVITKSRQYLPRADRILLLLQDGRQFSVKASFGSKACYVVSDEVVSKTIIRRVRRTNRAFFLSDALIDDELESRQSVKKIGQRSVLCAPIRKGERTVGVLYADSISLVDAFTEEEMKWAVRLCTSISRSLRVLPQERAEKKPPKKNHSTGKPKPRLTGIEGSKSLEKLPAFLKIPKPKLADKVILFRSLATLLSAGVTIYSSLQLLAESNTSVGAYCAQMAEDVAKGHPLSLSMTRYPDVFSPSEVQLLAIGENSGTLDVVSDTLARTLDRDWQLLEKLKSALTYPAVILIFCLLGCLIAPPLFLNDFFQTLAESSETLPPLTILVMSIAKWIWNPLTIGGLIAATYLCRHWFKKQSRSVETLLFAIPQVQEFYRDLVDLKFCRALAVQLEAGLYLDKSLRAAAQASSSLRLQEEVEETIEKLLAGESLAFALQRTSSLSRTALEFMAVGEETGKLGEMCRSVESLLSMKTENSLEAAQALVEPLAMACVGILVGVVALACMLPLVRMIQSFA